MIELTELGRDVAIDLKRANDRLNGILPESEQSNHCSPETEGSEANRDYNTCQNTSQPNVS